MSLSKSSQIFISIIIKFFSILHTKKHVISYLMYNYLHAVFTFYSTKVT
jgi:hypothetical protein